MQNSPELTHIWPTIAYTVVATSLANAAIWYTAWKNRKKPQSDIGLQDAQRQKTLADTLDSVIKTMAGAMMRIEQLEQEKARLQKDLMKAGDEIRRLRGNGR